MPRPKVVGLNIHPVKSTEARPLSQTVVSAVGLRGDREWMVVNTAGELVSARDLPALLGIAAATPITDPGLGCDLRLTAPGASSLEVATPTGPAIDVKVHRTPVTAIPSGLVADRWIRAVTGRDDLRLVWCHRPSQRRLDPAWAKPEDFTAFADSSPITLASMTSLGQVNNWMVEAALERDSEPPDHLTMKRFRPNIVVDGIPEPFAEDTWRSVRIGEVTFRVAALVSRCVMTTFNPATLEKGHEPIKTLARHRRWDGKTWFAIKLVAENEGSLRLGDDVEVQGAQN
ncbi:MOSC domain-containing protein [Demetria terragena]|uniref:MOSC domain-containing protein n=1 Tax=Demetria terragena TaxID=63959 RepID=UPI00037665C5|nr:MOSC N-terminal beta barrel domain-containing protein [Demetria terragena]